MPLFLLVILSLWAGCSQTLAEPVDKPLEFIERVVGLPQGANADVELPMVIVIHGYGDTPERFEKIFGDLGVPARIVAPRAPDMAEEGLSWFPIDDRPRAPALIYRRAQLVTDLADKLKKTRRVRGLPIVTGFSMGGILSFACAAYHAEHFAGAVPVAGRLYDPMPPYRKTPKGFQIVAFHGEQDRRVAYEGAVSTVQRLQKLGDDVTLTTLPNVGHSLPPELMKLWFGAVRDQVARLQ